MRSGAGGQAFSTAASAPGQQDEAYFSEVFHLFSQRAKAPAGAAEALLSVEQALQMARVRDRARAEHWEATIASLSSRVSQRDVELGAMAERLQHARSLAESYRETLERKQREQRYSERDEQEHK